MNIKKKEDNETMVKLKCKTNEQNKKKKLKNESNLKQQLSETYLKPIYPAYPKPIQLSNIDGIIYFLIVLTARTENFFGRLVSRLKMSIPGI